MKENLLEIGYLIIPKQMETINLKGMKKSLKIEKYKFKEILDDTFMFSKMRSQHPDIIHIGKNGEFSRFVQIIAYQRISKAIKNTFNIWKSTNEIYTKLIENTAIPVHSELLIIMITGNVPSPYIQKISSEILREFGHSYYGIETIHMSGEHCSIIQMQFKKPILSYNDLYKRIPEIEKRYNKLKLLHCIDDELNLPNDNLGFNFKDATISKIAMAKILLGIQRLKYGTIE